MTFHLASVQESDIDRMVSIEIAAYADNPIAQLFRARDGTNPAHITRLQNRYRYFVTSDPATHILQAVDPATGQMIAWIRWESISPCIDVSRPLDHELLDWPFEVEEQNWAMVRADYERFEAERRREVGGVAHCCESPDVLGRLRSSGLLTRKLGVDLGLLVVHPLRQRRGAGQLLVQAFVNEADRLGFVAYLNATPEGKALYERYGFVAVRDTVFDMSEYGGQIGRRTHTIMVRQPKTSVDV